ncbi:amidase [Streptomyces sp. NBC_01016]|uniref:amidase n=1 Tax=Streptomyces sp. NBC_01016 TaxID=2903720 RepID=UPI002250FF9E|nr:amidase [Streptomyces sp. NBC_01016]MCX4829103.1 amidase [Streptomyces sp. NBC_01016]
MPVRPTDSDSLCGLDAVELAGLVRRRELSARELVSAHLDRIERVNPALNAIVTLDAEGALAAAGQADELAVSGAELGPLHGLPIAFKDTHLTRGMRTTHGSPLFAEHVPDEDELLVERVQSAGAIRIGKTNVPEFAAGSHTFNPVFGATRNPYDRARSAGGSSGGAAAALAARLTPIADGSDMGGSLRNPASFCNVVGLRTTPGRVPSLPTNDLWETLGVAGPMGRTVADVALLLSAMAGPDPRCPQSLETPGSVFRAPLERDLKGLRVAYAPDLGGRVHVDPEVRELVARQVKVFEAAGAHVVEDCPDLDGAEDVFLTLRAQAFRTGLGPLLESSREQLKPSLIWNIEEGIKLTSADLARARTEHTRIHLAAAGFFERYDVLIAPVSQVLPFDVDMEYPTVIDGQPQHSYLDWMRSAYLLTVLGAPALSVPAGFTDAGLPVGLQIVGPPRAERDVLEIGAAYEAATGHGRRAPHLS